MCEIAARVEGRQTRRKASVVRSLEHEPRENKWGSSNNRKRCITAVISRFVALTKNPSQRRAARWWFGVTMPVYGRTNVTVWSVVALVFRQQYREQSGERVRQGVRRR